MYENVEEIEKLNEKQEQAINMLLYGKTAEEIAKDLNINTNTLYRWKKNKFFKQVLREKQDAVFDDITYKICSIGEEALNTLYDLMRNASNENNKIKASIFILDKISQYEHLELLKRLDFIEERLNMNG